MSVLFTILTCFLFVFAFAASNTTIGPNISTTGTLSVTNTTTFNGVSYGWPSTDGTNGQTLTTSGAGVLSWSNISTTTAGGWTDSASNVILASTTDYVGIGTTTPYAKLSVVGEIVSAYITATSTAATSTFSTGFELIDILKVFTNKTVKFLSDVVADFTAVGKLLIPIDRDPTVDTIGQIAINNGTTSIRFFDGVGERALYIEQDKGFSFASSTLSYLGSYSTTGTTTITLINHYRPITLTQIYCKTDTGTASIQFSDGTNDTEAILCTTSGGTNMGSITNNTWTMREDFKIKIGTQGSDPNIITVTATIIYDAD